MTQSFNIPDGFSPDMLQAMMKEAIPEEVAHAVELSTDHDDDGECEDCEKYANTGMTSAQIVELAHTLVEEATEKCPDPIIHKVILDIIIGNMIHWHSVTGGIIITDGEDDVEQATGWLRDAGKFQAIVNILDTISVGPNDFTCSVK